MTIPFKEILVRQAGLLSLSKSDCDLFLIAQANSVTYSQLAISGLHGSTKTSGRISIKNLEKEGYLLSRVLPGAAREKYFILSAKGKKRVEKIFGEDFLKSLSIDLDRRPPTSTQQLPHRIHTGDIYFVYLANPCLEHLPVWQIEIPYQKDKDGLPVPRCDGMLASMHHTYYVEQDNNTQGDTALSTKIRQYMDSSCFLGDAAKKNALIFTINCETKERSVAKPPFSIYRILLKAQRVWKCLETEYGTTLSFQTFCMQFENSQSPSLAHLSRTDRKLLKNLSYKYPSIKLDELAALKKTYLYDTSPLEEQHMEQDELFAKRLKQKFYPFLSGDENATLRQRLQKGMLFFVLPNHRLPDYLPFAMQKEYGFPNFLLRLLYSMGINEMELWDYHEHYTLKDPPEICFYFRNVFSSQMTEHLIVVEDVVHDLGGRERMTHFLTEQDTPRPVLFVLFVSSRQDAAEFLALNEKRLRLNHNRFLSFCFLEKTAKLYHNAAGQDAYFKQGPLWLPAQLDFDRFLGELRLIERQV